jgi:hypothetical protein
MKKLCFIMSLSGFFLSVNSAVTVPKVAME